MIRDIKKDYDEKAEKNDNVFERQQKQTVDLLKFNNWIKSVLISEYTKQMCNRLQNVLDLQKGTRTPLLHVLDVGCGRGQDIKKWKGARVKYMVASDFSDKCIQQYEKRWRELGEPFKLYLVQSDFTKMDLYPKIEHAKYDIISAQFCFHYMFGTSQGLKYGLANILSNLLIDGVFIATIPDSYAILKKIKEKGVVKNGATYYNNKYLSIRFQKTHFAQPYGNEYGFCLKGSVGSENQETNEIQYTNQWLISLDNLEEVLKPYGVQIEYTKNFLEFYLEYRERREYNQLFSIMGLTYEQGRAMDPELWEIAHIYRVLVCRKKRTGTAINEYPLNQRLKATEGKQIRRTMPAARGGYHDRGRSYSNNHHHNSNSRGRPNYGNYGNNNNNGNNSYGNNNNHGNNRPGNYRDNNSASKYGGDRKY